MVPVVFPSVVVKASVEVVCTWVVVDVCVVVCPWDVVGV